MRDRETKEKVNKEIKIILAGKSVEGGKIGKKTGLTGGRKSAVVNKKSDQAIQLKVHKKKTYTASKGEERVGVQLL